MAGDGLSPHIVDGSSPLETVALRAIKQYGEWSPSSLGGEYLLMFIDFAASILDDIMEHPYWTGGNVPYYVHLQDRREVPDTILQAGLLSKLSVQLQSAKAQRYEQEYFKRMNQVLLRMKFGPSASFEMQAFDQRTRNGGVS